MALKSIHYYFSKYYGFYIFSVFKLQRAAETKMTDGNNVEHLSVVTTTETANDVTQTTAATATAAMSSSSVVYFRCAVVVIGVVGTAANALILYALVASKEHKKHVLIFHQNVLDFISSLLLVITDSLKLCDIYIGGFGGYWFCMLIDSECVLWVVILSSKVNLIFVTIERYLKVVYHVWSKTKLRDWMMYSAMAFAWISGFVHMTATAFTTSVMIHGVCYTYVFWKSRASLIANRVFYFLYFYVIILVIFVFCYWRILVAIRRQASVMAGHSAAGSSTGQAQLSHIQTNVVKTMIFVSAFFAICDLPINVFYILTFTVDPRSIGAGFYYVSLFMTFVYICANPFIYATKFDPVKRVLLDLIPCKKTPVQPSESVEVAARRTTANRSGHSRN